ncbi:trypsin-like peptidase domain-containing protein [Streptomyces oryzae]|uniref:Trypsin-like peptidase domain-containing protein n=1 Tax=Streptomyces oryzae TaxID=1434886 RepID=A0ABS3X740_9ACTN|nr:trypsin-like peptidase domain-containing protein [Streptomyces oryzae]MBO8191198.1 trypsin-like peptidase domain-containing protein [Streptomyces oryzae]
MENFGRENPQHPYDQQNPQSRQDPQSTASFGAVPPPPAGPPYATFPTQPGPPARRRMRRPAALLTTVAVAAAVIGGGTAYGMEQLLGGGSGASAAAPAASGSNATAKGRVSQVVESVQDSVVEIKATSGSGQATGSGVIITKDGQIVTNNHVVSGADTVKVTFSSGRTAQAKVVGTDADKDLALLKVDGQDDLQPAALGDSDAVGVGDQVVAIGSPEGLSGTVTSGIVSAKDREVKVPKEDGNQSEPQGGQGGDSWPFEYGGGQYNGGVQGETTTYKAIQTDASLNPGNSGGPLFNMAGQVIGINSAIFSSGSGDGQASQSSAGSVGLGFAIPVNDVKQDLGSLRDGGA